MDNYGVSSMEEKKADNKIDKNKTIKAIDDKIEEKNKSYKEIKDVEEGIKSLRKSINRCIELLSFSMSGEASNKILSISNDVNVNNSKKMMQAVDNIKSSIRDDLKKLNAEREATQQQKEE